MEIHPVFYDPTKIQLEGAFQEKLIVNKLCFVNMLAINVHYAFKFSSISLIIFFFLLASLSH